MIRINEIIEKVESYIPGVDKSVLEKAYVFSAKIHQGQVRLSGEPYLIHPIEVANILVDMRLDPASIVSGLLHDTVEDTYTNFGEIERQFGNKIARLVDGVTKISMINFNTHEEQQAENVRKMILAMAEDIRVILIKLADRLHNMRTLKYHVPEKQVEIAQETLDIYAPIANRLGIEWIKTELEDLSFKYLKEEIYSDLVRKVAKNQEEREEYIEKVKDIITKRLSQYNLKFRMEGRPKHYYSIYQKMLKQNIDFEQVFDLIAFRIIVSTIKECYEVLGYIHSLFRPVPSRFKDYIGMPKPNMYQSLHTTVIGPFGERVEIQIRSEDMHRIAEHGIASHWKYKEGKGFEDHEGDEFAWLRQLIEWQQELKDPKEFLESVRLHLYPDDVYVFTPKGDVKAFPIGANPVDFAYSIHTDIGNHCIGAKINGRIVPLSYQLKNGDTVEIITSANRVPTHDWLKFVVTSKAKTRIRQWLKTVERERSITLGKDLCEREFRKYGLSLSKASKKEDFKKVIEEFSFSNLDDLLAAVGHGNISVSHIINKLIPKDTLETHYIEKVEKGSRIKKKSDGGVKIRNVDDVLVHFGKCCNPLPGNSIVGFITRGNGVTIHTFDCQNIVEADPDRVIEASWDLSSIHVRPVKIKVTCWDKKGLLADLSYAISKAGINITKARVQTTLDKRASNIFEIEVKDLNQLNTIINSLKRVDGVVHVERLKT